MKHSEEFQAFDTLMDKILSVSHEEIKRREAEYRKRADMNPSKPGPKRKVKASGVSPGPADH